MKNYINLLMNSRALRYQKIRLEYVICIYDILKTFLYVAENNVGTRPHPFAFSSLHNVKKGNTFVFTW